jgi:DNA primase catalytic subunit
MADPLAALLGPRTTAKKLATEPAREPTKEQRVAALKVTVRRETEADKEKRKREKEEIKLSQMTDEERQKKARIEQELADTTAFLEALEAEERRQIEANTLVRDGSEKPATSSTYKAREEADLQAADEARADRSDAVLNLGTYFADKLFPVDAVVQYVTRNGRIPLRHTEFAVITQKDAFWRHRHFDRADSLRDWLADVAPKRQRTSFAFAVSLTPFWNRLEIGPWHMELSKVSMGKTPYANLPVQRYLVFDLDMTDFEVGNRDSERDGYIRKCRCRTKKSGTCSYGCWFYMRVGVKVITYLMRKCFGAQEVIAIFSGNRGIHILCLDESFVALDSEHRKGIISRIKMFADPATGYHHDEFTPYIYEYLMKPEFYAHWLDGQCLIMESHTTLRMLVICTGLEGVAELPEQTIPILVRLSNAGSAPARVESWKELCEVLGGPDFERRFIFKAMFPRLDEEVTTGMGHPLKAPFVIHPSTRRCSVPIPDLDKWLPHMAPRASELIPLPPDDKVPVWVQEKEARRCAMVLAEYVQHLSLVMHRAYPLPIGQSFMMPKTTTTTKSISVASMEPVDHSEDDGRYDDVME